MCLNCGPTDGCEPGCPGIKPADDTVNHPGHYGGDGPYETIKVLEAWDPERAFGFCWGNAVKYLSRAGKKNPMTLAEDLAKAAWYADEAARMAREKMLDELDEKLERESEQHKCVQGLCDDHAGRGPFYWDKDGDLWEHTELFGSGWFIRWQGGKDWGAPTATDVLSSLEEVSRDYGPLRAANFVPMEKKD